MSVYSKDDNHLPHIRTAIHSSMMDTQNPVSIIDRHVIHIDIQHTFKPNR